MIEWTAFDWQSFSTLTTGVLAVIAAFFVGLKQNKIAHRQTKILEKQVNLSILTLRHEIFEKRYRIYLSVRDFLAEIVRTGKRPSPDIEHAFILAMSDSEIIFQTRVHKELQAIWKLATNYYTTISHDNILNSDSMDNSIELMNNIFDKLTNIIDIFGEELILREVFDDDGPSD